MSVKAEKFNNKYRVPSHRMPNWDYSGNGVYFITIVTQNRECILGQIVTLHGSQNPHVPHVPSHAPSPPPSPSAPAYILLSDFGKIVHDEWLKSFEIRNELFLDEYVIMPNHIHAIVILIKPKTEKLNSTHNPHEKSALIRKPQSISSFIAGFKSVVNTEIDDFIDQHHLDIPKYNRNNHFFQPNYHDHVIRNDSEYRRIKKYIITNPLKWNNDKFNPKKEVKR